MTQEAYPTDRKRSGYFARYAKALFASNAVGQHGRDVVMLVLFVASREDKLHYSKPPKFWRAELMEQLSITSPKALIAIRQVAIGTGLLHYVEGSRTRAAQYWTLTPNWLVNYMRPVPNRNASKSTRSKLERETERETEHETERILIPSTQYPTTLGNRTPKPTVQEIKSYCQERGNSVNPEQFFDHYQANGWVQGRGKPIRDWKAAVRTWERNGLSTQSNGKPDPSHIPFKSKRARA